MGNWKKQQDEFKEARTATKENEKISRETLGKYFYDLSKLSFGAMVLGVIVPWFTNMQESSFYWILFLIGIFTTILFAMSGYRTIKNYRLWMDYLLY